MKKKKPLLYGLFHNRWDDTKDAIEEDTTPTLKRFFKLFGRKFWNLISLNLMMLPMIIPIIVAIFLYMGIAKTPSANNPIFAQLYGAGVMQNTPASTFLLDLFGAQFQIPAYNATGTYVGIGICAAFLIITFGWQNVGVTYILRSLVRGDPVFLFTDYFYAIKRNWKQGFFLWLLDLAILFFLGFDFLYFQGQVGSFGQDLMYWAIIALAILYFFMRFYIYHLQITFELSIRKILKNALIFTTLGIKRNLMALLGIVALTTIAVALVALTISLFGMNLLPIPVMLTLMIFLAATAFMTSYAAYPIIDRYMIAPFVTDEDTDEDAEETPEEEAD